MKDSAKVGGSSRKYLLYAIGEILLVMIGILLALQVNNWNEWRKDRVKEKEVLENLAENLESNINELKSLLSTNERSNQASSIILNVIENKLPFVDSLTKHFGYALDVIDSGDRLSLVGYESLKNTGIEIIRNKELKKQIILLYEDTFNDSKNKLDRNGKIYTEIIKLRQEYFFRLKGFRFTPFNFNQLIEDKYYHSWLLTISSDREWANNYIKKSLHEATRILTMINKELSQ